jgi:acyl carrier protein
MRDTSSRPSTRQEFERALTDLIAHGLTSRRRKAVPSDLNGETPLFQTGLIDSLAILELIAFVEEATGRPIPARQVHMRHFGTIDRICAAFWNEEHEVCDEGR